ncbi:MAG: alpha/beta hydrolase [Bacteroidota bacterium]
MSRSPGRRYWLNLTAFVLGLLALIAAGAVVWFTLARTGAYLHPPRQSARGELLRQNGIRYQQITLTTEDGLRLRAWYTPPHNGAVILLAHGHGSTIFEDYYLLFASHGYGVLAWDFRAHGDSGGQFTTFGYKEALDVKAALDFAEAQPSVGHIGAWGGSMGAAAVIHAAAAYPEIEAVVADSAYPTLREIAEMRSAPLLRPLVYLYGRMKTGVSVGWLRPVEDIARISPRPVLLIQGLDDSAIPPDSARRLYEAAGEPRSLWVEPGVVHMGMYRSFPGQYTSRVIGFFDRALLSP